MNKLLVNAIEDLRPALGALFDKIGADSRDGAGITRDAFGPRETQAAMTIAEFSHKQGLETCFDRGGNLHIAGPGQLDQAAEIVLASHLDSVPIGGNYDGLAGVIGGLAVLTALRRCNGNTSGLRVVGFRGEESPWFGTAYLGSRLLLGELTPQDLHMLRRYDTKKTLAEHLAALGIEPPTTQLQPTMPLERLRAYFELHIEQAPLLENMNRPLGLATAIRGNIRYPAARCVGSYAHSGAVPRVFRRDAVIATAKLIAFADARWQQLIGAGNEDLVFTCGIFHTDPAEHTMTKVPGLVTFSLNIGGIKNEIMEDLHKSIFDEAAKLACEHNVEFEFGKRVGTPAVDLDRSVQALVEEAGQETGITPVRMPTVGHDAAMFQRRGIPTSVLLVRNSGGSHNPEEHMDFADFEAGTKVLATAVSRLL